MKIDRYIFRKILYFSRWCGKGYAVFAALGQQVQIASLAMHICLCALLKSARKGLIINGTSIGEEKDQIINQKEQQILVLCFQEGEVCPESLSLLKL